MHMRAVLHVCPREYLLETCHRLKEAAGLAEDFWYSELDIKNTLASERQRMQGVIKVRTQRQRASPS